MANSPLTDEQAGVVALGIAQTGNNIYDAVASVIGRWLTADELDATYEHVERIGHIFRCVECNIWKADSEKSPDLVDWCDECASEDL